MYCPECKCEYIDGIDYCKSCEIQLVHELETKKEDEISFVLVKAYDDPFTAELEKGVLTNLGIDSILTGIDSTMISSVLSGSQSIDLLVDKRDLRKAKTALEVSDHKDKTEQIGESEFVPELVEPPSEEESIIDQHQRLEDEGEDHEAEVLEETMLNEFADDPDVLYYLASIRERDGQYDESDELFEKALVINPNDNDIRRAVAVNCIRENKLSRAAQLISFMRRRGPDQEFEVLYMLANRYQENSDHYQALNYYKIIVRDFPEIALTDKYFRDSVEASEKHRVDTPSILPKRQLSLNAYWFAIGAITVAIIVSFFLFN